MVRARREAKVLLMSDNKPKPQDIDLDAFVKGGGGSCPYCEGGDLEGESFDMPESGRVTQRVFCNDCHGSWVETFALSGVELLGQEQAT